ncbi:histidine phosphatase family protein [Pseudonocardia sp. EV170527-09]|nr:histidine phosphatase family protein [Pseudonocardia sp. EV170527-09]
MSHPTDDEHDGAASFAAVGTGSRTAQVPPDDDMLRLVLVRHGRTPSNVRHRLDTALPGPSLDELGRAQAEEVAGLLAGWPVRGLYASRATRAQETAAPIGRALGRGVTLL